MIHLDQGEPVNFCRPGRRLRCSKAPLPRFGSRLLCVVLDRHGP